MATFNGNGNGNGSGETVTSTAHGATARCVARSVVVAFDACADSGVPLSQLQKVTLIESVLLEFDGFGIHLASLATLGQMLGDLGWM